MTTLTMTAKETEMLVAVMSEMGEIPSNINFDRVAARVNVKFARNARQSFKKLFEKLKDQAGPSPDDEDGATPSKTPSPTKKTSPKKKVGPKNAPIKATAKPRGKKGAVKKEEVDSGDELAEPVLNDEDGKSPEHIPSLKAESLGKNSVVGPSTGSPESLQISDEVAKMSVVEAEETFSTFIEEGPVDEQADLDEQLLAAQSDISVDAYRHWKALNDYTFLQSS
ncbi:hypothetical protein BCON_0019g00720 [Botryotinia convoluta]|uniref:Uncharacterized protein n=1 Tax=Botryotinia convoluta TaxID=54673 RepID=A0A4Z1IMA2_9HELO|nr:hypothetical protein BCON_0019g00720 [Botryotinia convoluta]